MKFEILMTVKYSSDDGVVGCFSMQCGTTLRHNPQDHNLETD
jgi:hypothetical protein